MRAYDLGSEPRVPERLPITSAAGLAFLAACAEGQRAPLLTRLGLSADEIMTRLAEIRARGAALVDMGPALLVAVPVVARGIGLGALALKAPHGALADQAVDRLVALLTAAAAEIGATWAA
jgi:DNA-binding IclR family transcriptional regulator